ncbi:interleukin-17 receptor A isoform X2 [Lissotriton helveticus]
MASSLRSSLVPWIGVLLLGILCPGTAAIWILESPPFNCSQEGLGCHVTRSSCLHESWFRTYRLTPSAPSLLEVDLAFIRDEKGQLYPTLNIKWRVATDASVVFLQGALLQVWQMVDNAQVCAQFNFENELEDQRRPDGEKWQFAYDRFIVDPGISYKVVVHHLPMLDGKEDMNQKSQNFTVPGNTWKPNIAVDVQQRSNLVVSFSSSNLSSTYHVLVNSYSPSSEVSCKRVSQVVSQVGPHQRVNVSIVMDDARTTCCQYKVEIWGFFPGCGSDCPRIVTQVPCPTFPPQPTISPGLTGRDHWYIMASCALLVCLGTAGIIFLVVMPGQMKPEETEDSPPPFSKNPKVWIVYSADHALYVDVVLKLADFLRVKCAADVVLDLLQENEIAKVGIMAWLSSQKQNIEKQSGKIIIMCSSGAQAKWQAMMDKPRVSLRQDRKHPFGDCFTAALNLIMPDFQLPANFGKYIIAYVGDISTEDDIPEPFKTTSKYRLMEKFEEVFFRIHDREQYEPGRMLSVEEVTAQDYTQHPSGQYLQAAICKFRKFQEIHPDWFMKECLEESPSHHSVELDMNVSVDASWDPLLRESATLKLQPFFIMPKDSDSLFVDVHIQEPEAAVTRIEPLLPHANHYEQTAHQTEIYFSDAAGMGDFVQRQEPLFSMEYANTGLKQQPYPADWTEGVPVPQVGLALKTDILLNDGLEHLSLGGSKDSQNWPLPGTDNLSEEEKMNLEQLKQFQQCLTSFGHLHLDEEEQQLVQVSPGKDLGDQRQSLQSDQGYSSRTSSPPLEASGDGMKSVGKEPDSSDTGISPQDLEMVKKMHMQFFLQSAGLQAVGPL